MSIDTTKGNPNPHAFGRSYDSRTAFKEDELIFSPAIPQELAAALFPELDVTKRPIHITYRQNDKKNIPTPRKSAARPLTRRYRKKLVSSPPLAPLAPTSSPGSVVLCSSLDSLPSDLAVKCKVDDQNIKEIQNATDNDQLPPRMISLLVRISQIF
ncbi:hypothetical protein BC937DRAFT_88956 [Endogone sp. FLAS-F59071]|nr:hypothetical protein BC937DRAFT_88956 [Endogone sp. FLAS-F59071]|eukprot:RUS18289.1 hypothetical protein BC937DRAFT_88956 [Endogone sp. FLAS-F59071]